MDESIKRKLVLIGAGHGGHDSGAVSGGAQEKDINLDVTTALALCLANRGHEVMQIREFDVFKSLSERLDMIAKYKPAAFVSIHCNALDDDPETAHDERKYAHGFEVFYRDEYDKPLAKAVHHYLTRTGLRDRGILRDVDRLGKRLTVLNDYKTPAVLVELGFLTHSQDRKYVLHHKQAMAELIGYGVHDFLEGG